MHSVRLSSAGFGGWSVLASACAMALAQSAWAAAPATAPVAAASSGGPVEPIQHKDQILTTPDYTGDIGERSTMSGDWGGTRQELANHGVTLDGYLTQVTQGVVSGGRQDGWQYLGRGEVDLNLDTAKLGLWPGGLFTVMGEGRYGNPLSPAYTGTVYATDVNELFPQPENGFWLPEVMYTQFVSPKLGFFVGKVTTITADSGDMNNFAHGKGDQQFLNTAFAFDPVVTVTVPYSTLGFGTIILPDKDLVISASVLNPHGTADNAGFDELFADGATFALFGQYTTHFSDLKGHQLLGGTYSTSSYDNLDQRAADFIIPGLPVQKADNSWCAYYNMDQYLYQPDSREDRGVGVFGRLGLSDGIANPIRSFASFGLGGKGMIPGRSYDQFGVGYYYAGASDGRLVSSLGFRDAQGVEAYYQFAITRWAQLSPDIQWVRPSSDGVSSEWVLGVRLNLVF